MEICRLEYEEYESEDDERARWLFIGISEVATVEVASWFFKLFECVLGELCRESTAAHTATDPQKPPIT